MKAYKYRLYPTQKQRHILQQTLDECRWLYNYMLAHRRDSWQERQESVSLYDTIKMIPALKREHPTLKTVHSQVLQNVCVRLDLAFQAFFRRVKNGETPGYPRFRGHDRYDSFTYPQSGFSVADGRLRLSKIGDV